jgi:hypothetical protein
MRLARSYVRGPAKGITPACCVVWWKQRHGLSRRRRVQFIRCKSSRYTTQRHPSDENRGRTGEGRGEGGSGEMGMPPLDSKGPPPEARTEAPPRTGKPQLERKLADEAQTRACQKLGYICVCLCVCVESKHPSSRPARHRERMFPRHTM